jgi:ribosome-associated toxin RatA of RatAB toxin-antitoxin module
MPGSAIPQVLIATHLAAPAAAVYGVVTDYAHFADFIPDVAESRIIRTAGDAQWVFHRLHFTGPVADRVYVMRSVGRTGSADTYAYRVEWALAPEAVPTGEQGIAPRQFSGFWELRPADDGKTTEARYAVHSDPGGRIPVWLVSRMTDRYVREVVRAVRGRLEQVDPNTGRRR